MRILFSLAFTLVLSACGSDGGGSNSSGSGGGDLISNPPSNSTLPTGSATNSGGAGGAGGGTCGMSGRYGLCTATPMLMDTASVRVFETIESNCTDIHLRVDYYTGANCTGSVYFTRLDKYTAANVSASGVVAGAMGVDVTFVNRVETYSAVGRAGAHASDYKSCPSRTMGEFVADTPVTSTATQCDGTTGTIVDYDIAKVTAAGLFLGNQSSCTSYFAGSYKACTTVGARPTALDSNGVPPWN